MKEVKFKSLKEEREHWDTHSIADIWDSLEQIELKFTKKEKLKTVSVRFSEEEISEIKNLSKHYGIGYTNLIREIVRKAIERLTPTQ
jgi:predicted DNA binding CopG/RHH family protein